MTETARRYAIVLYELEIPGQMVKNAADVIKENPELNRVLAWQSYSLRMEGVMEAELHYVTMPGAAQIAGMKQFLCSRYHKKDIDLRLVMQPDLVGGFVLKAGDTEYDYSLKGQLNQLCRAVVR